MNKIIKDVCKTIAIKFDQETADKVLIDANQIFDKMMDENLDKPKAVKKHFSTNLFPAISLYKALIKNNVESQKAYEFMDWCWSERAIPKAKSMQALCKIPGMYKKMPAIFKKVTLSTFGENQGFKSKFYETEKTRCKFDMTKCLFCDTCKRYDCFELTPIFCHTDDVTDGNIHPKLKWNRTKVMGEGGDCCDFDLFVID